MAVTTIMLPTPIGAEEGAMGTEVRGSLEGLDTVIPLSKVDPAVLGTKVKWFDPKLIVRAALFAMIA